MPSRHLPATLLLSVLWLTPALAQTTPPTPYDPTHLTVDAIDRGPNGNPPHNLVWSPDGKLLTWIIDPGQTLTQDGASLGKPGDIAQVDAATGRISILATSTQLEALGTGKVSEQDRDHRARYAMSAFLWADDSKHLLLDKGGMLWLYDISAGTGTLIVDTQAGSGDDPKFSPDGHSVSYLRDHNLFVHHIDPTGKPSKEIALTKPEGDAILNGELDWVYLEELDARSNYAWSPDSANIAYLQMNEQQVPQYSIVDFMGTHSNVDRQRYPQPGDHNPGVRVGVVPAKGGRTTWIALPISLGDDYIPRFGWVDPNTLYIQLLTRDQHQLGLYFADIRTGVSRLVHSETDAKYLEDNYDVFFLPHGRFLNTSWRDGHTHIYLYQFDEQHPLDAEATLVKQLTQGDFEVDSLTIPHTPNPDTIFFSSTEGSPLEDNLWSIHLDGTAKQKLTSTHGVHDTNLSPDGTHFADTASALNTPPTVTLCTISSSICGPIWTPRARAAVTGVTSSIVQLLAADGITTLYGTLVQPDATVGTATIPLILNPYGGPIPYAGIRNAWGGVLFQFSELLAQHGFAVLTVDNRGSGGRGRDFQQADYHDFGQVQLADQLAALDQTLAKNPQFDPKRIGWWGWSWGGTFTLNAMTHSDRIRAGVAVAPVTDFRNYDSIYTERYLGLPAANPEVYTQASVKATAANLKGRILIAEGTGDDNVHLANTIQFLQPLINAGIPYDLQLFPRLTHSIAGLPARNELFNRILYHFETYLKTP